MSEKQAMTVDQLRGMGNTWKNGTINGAVLPSGTYTFGVLIPKEAELPDPKVAGGKIKRKFPVMEVIGHGSINMRRILANTLLSETPTKARTGNYYFPTRPVSDQFQGDLAVIAVELQNKIVELEKVSAREQTGFPVPGNPWKTPEEATENANIVNREVYRVVSVKNLDGSEIGSLGAI